MANSSAVRDFVADRKIDLGVVASRPDHTPYPGVREMPLAPDEVVCAVPRAHRWARLGRITLKEFLRTPMVLRDPASNARWTVDAVLRRRGLQAAPPLLEAGTPHAAQVAALAHRAPVLLSRHVLDLHAFAPVVVEGLAFPREYVLVLPGTGEPTREVAALIERLRAHVAEWAA
jgi:DNA-binding transcriptional LysR family regulator